jgi:hypothetical protein
MQVRLYLVAVVGAFLLAMAYRIPLADDESVALASAASPSRTLISQYCTTCHDAAETAGGLALDRLDPDHPDTDPHVWESVVRKLRTGMMPPAGEPRPERAALEAFAADLEGRLDAAAATAPNPGAPRLHRLNRVEYANAVRDLLALEIDVALLLPADDAIEGFDNISDALGVSPSLIEGYVAAAMKVSRAAVGDRGMIPERVEHRPPRGLSQSEHIEGLPLGTRGGLLVEHNFPLDAEYEIRIDAGVGPGLVTREEPPMADVSVTLNGAPLQPEDYHRFRMRLPAGPARIGVALLDRRRVDGADVIYAPMATFRTSSVRSVVIIGPYDATGPGDTPSRRRIFSCHPGEGASEAAETACARENLLRLARLAYRRPVAEGEAKIETLMAFYEQGREAGDFETGVQRALARLLVDPEFLFRFEAEPVDLDPGAVYRISDLELASRLSFFLWSSIPGEELLTLAADGRLGDPQVMRAQIDRMLADPRADALVESFAGQWLQLRKLEAVEPEARGWNANLRQSFERETELLFASLIAEDRSIVDLLDADYTFVDERLARHYGMSDVRGSHFRRVALAEDSPRRGVLGHGSLLTVTSVANRTSPVVRGAWILENLMGAPPPKPPPGVETDLDTNAAERPPSLRARLELHREDPVCSSCHSIMDPVGLALENFNLIGAWREDDNGEPIDASGALVDGTPLDGPASLRAALLDRSDVFVTVATEKLMTYALGRTLEPFDMPAVRKVVRDAADEDYAFSALIYGVAESLPFRMRMKMGEGRLDAAGEARAAGAGE